MASLLRPCLALFAFFTVLTGLVFPALVTGIAQVVFPHQANGSLVMDGDTVVGSELIGQPFDDPKYFWGRPSMTGTAPYNAAASAGSNQGPLNPALHDAVKGRIEALRAADPENDALVPIDLATASGSGLDPHISPAAAYYQVGRVARARGLPEADVKAFVGARVEGRWLGLLGEPRVNVLLLNRALDRAKDGIAGQ